MGRGLTRARRAPILRKSTQPSAIGAQLRAEDNCFAFPSWRIRLWAVVERTTREQKAHKILTVARLGWAAG